uniref:Dihydroorotate dehydrogenase catalytic domain-containing protein n=1 Tax=Desulfobacca acetoxidans TaxID=60893 RepID=A0A7C5ENI9_9BACT
MRNAGPHRLSTVLISTALGQDGRGIFPYTLWPPYRRLLRVVRETGTTVLTKSATRHPRRGNFVPLNPLTWRYIRRLPKGGLLNAYGLTNAGVQKVAPRIASAHEEGFRVIPNFWPDLGRGRDLALKETLEAVGVYREHLGVAFWALELNLSCPNIPDELACQLPDSLALVQKLRELHPDLFLIVKISVVHPYEFAQELEKLGVGALHGVNTIPYDLVFPPDRYPPSPMARVGGGGVSGGPAFPLAYQYNAGLRKKVKLPLIMGGGVTGPEGVRKYLDLGADSVSLCTLVLREPHKAEEIIHNYQKSFP